jgi:hypothetical protein
MCSNDPIFGVKPSLQHQSWGNRAVPRGGALHSPPPPSLPLFPADPTQQTAGNLAAQLGGLAGPPMQPLSPRSAFAVLRRRRAPPSPRPAIAALRRRRAPPSPRSAVAALRRRRAPPSLRSAVAALRRRCHPFSCPTCLSHSTPPGESGGVGTAPSATFSFSSGATS